MSNEQEVDQQQKDKQDAGKEQKKFEGNVKKLTALLVGESELLKPGKVPKDTVRQAMEILVKEKKEEMIANLKTEVSVLLDKYRAFNKFQQEKKKEMEKAVADKLKEFNKEAGVVFQKMEGIDQLEKEYFEALMAVSTPVQEPTTDASEEVKAPE